jgi:alpha-L-rhamnosidase
MSRSPVQASSGWKRYVVDPGAVVYPKRVEVVGAASAVTDPEGMKAPGGAVTTIRSTGSGAPRLVLDLGANTGGYVEVGITGTDGTQVRLGYSELRRFLTPEGDNCTCGGIRLSVGADDDPDARTDVIAPSGGQSWRSPGIRGGQRYVSVQLEGAGTVSIDYVRVRVTHLRAPVSAYAGHFLSSDRLLNRAWYASVYTFAMDAFRDLRPAYRTSSRTVVTDGAKRDRLIWAGDLAIENLLGSYSLRAAPAIIKNSLEAFSCQQLADGELPPLLLIATRCPQDAPSQPGDGVSPFPEYTAWWVVALHDYVVHTGDPSFARRMMPIVRRALGYFAGQMRNGVYVTPSTGLNWHPADTAPGEDAYTTRRCSVRCVAPPTWSAGSAAGRAPPGGKAVRRRRCAGR